MVKENKYSIYITIIIIILPGQSCSLQGTLLFVSNKPNEPFESSQSCAPMAGTGLSHFLSTSHVPLPQVLEHTVVLTQSDQLPATEILEIEILS